ncbi:cyclic pyranopterin monophosphate synthase MoaC [Endozoicomonas sp. ONNA2]|uniref:cyclic pyranopterin monophosphate synthase MoaC n=1 Tax=Endozoicomonas sp. ONNA2 TaxID=2828741 RepID=UPI00214936F5|nr:cyclic pyranopterin monophosphate synthase MoaC [Endozoicomonas sp. ONNA2]
MSFANNALSHIDSDGKASMVDVGEKDITRREARAEGYIYMAPETLALVKDNGLKKGDVLAVARIAGIQAAKQCSQLVPLCHPLMLNFIGVEFQFDSAPSVSPPSLNSEACIRIETCCRLNGKTGVEIEALTAASVAALTIYDMCKAVDKEMHIEGIRVLEKSGGRSGHYIHGSATSAADGAA